MIEKINSIEKRKAQQESPTTYTHGATSEEPQTDRLKRLVTLAKASTISLNAPFEQNEGSTLEDAIPDLNSEHPLDELIRHGDYDVIIDKIKLLDAREQKVMKTRFGLDGSKPSKLIEIANLLGLTKERVRQIEQFAIVKLRRMFFAEQGEEMTVSSA